MSLECRALGPWGGFWEGPNLGEFPLNFMASNPKHSKTRQLQQPPNPLNTVLEKAFEPLKTTTLSRDPQNKGHMCEPLFESLSHLCLFWLGVISGL